MIVGISRVTACPVFLQVCISVAVRILRCIVYQRIKSILIFPIIRHFIIIVIGIICIPHSIAVGIELVVVGNIGTVVLIIGYSGP